MGSYKQLPTIFKGLSTWQRAARYNESVALAKELATEGKVLIVAPDDTCGVSTLTRDAAALQSLYEKGLRDGKKIESFL